MGIESLPRTLELVREGSSRPVLRFIDQTKLPLELVVEETHDWQRVVEAIKRLEIRGAPAIGLAGAAALVLAAEEVPSSQNSAILLDHLSIRAGAITAARPTAVNLSWAVDQVMDAAQHIVTTTTESESIKEELYCTVKKMEQEDEAVNRAMGEKGATLLEGKNTVLTHCNAGSLATGFYGTALGVIYTAYAQGKIARVFVDETRPVAQGARLSAWELARVGIPSTLICDDVPASLMRAGKIDAIFVGADRIVGNGDIINKIGTYNLAIAAKYHHVPFYVVAPTSTMDLDTKSGDEVVIEERDRAEVTSVALDGVEIYNPAFDITPFDLVSALVTEKGIYTACDELR